jgi:putative Ca2+/H+ antiporter (TMEM165/GDT1 family)
MQDFLEAFALIFIAEMGDKTQIMAMAFATKYKISHILFGVAIGSFLNHGLAILLGTFLNQLIPIEGLQLVAGVLFITFGLLSLSIAEEEEEKISKQKFGAIGTVALAFFLGELGDKTQLTALTLSTQAVFPAFTLVGTVLGMVVVSSIGIFIGAKLGDKIPEYMIRFGSFVIFMLFGINKIFNSSYVQSMGTTFIWILVGMLILLTIYRFIIFTRQLKEVSVSALRQKAKDLKHYREQIMKEIDQLCHGCDVCRDTGCVIGYMKGLLSERMLPNSLNQEVLDVLHNKDFDAGKAKVIIKMIDEYFEKYPTESNENRELRAVKRVLEDVVDKNIIQFNLNM